MINLRYHIVSITAVFLALAIGIAMGSTFIDKATVDTLRSRLDGLEGRVEDTEAENSQLRGALGAMIDRQRELAEEGTAQLLQGHLDGVPVVMVAARGVDEDSVDGAQAAIASSGAVFGGTLWITDRLRLDDEDEIDDLAQVLGLPTDDAERLRRSVTFRIASILLDSTTPAGPADTTTTVAGVPDTTPPLSTSTSTTVATGASVLLDELRAGGFVDFEPPPGATDDQPIVPAPGTRYLVVGGPGADTDGEHFLFPLLDAMASGGIVPVVAAQAAVGENPEENRTLFVGPIRDDDELKERLSTVDDLETFAGWAGVVLALENLAAGEIGHFGVGEGADRLLPAPVTGP